ncbi:hypothetical protein [Streptomyces antibioticus]|uniref:hypothetical protein n=1 Tax=Streptomyces antibioticus TaxID=1890 RepID=UPI0036FE8A70
MIATLVGAACPLLFLLAALGLIVLAHRDNRATRARHDQALHASGAAGPPPHPTPCCPFWQQPDGHAHVPACTRKD